MTRTAVKEDEDGPATLRSVAFWGEDTNGTVGERIVLDTADLERLGAAHDGGGVADGRGPGQVMNGDGVHQELLVEGGIFWKELVRDLGGDGLVDGRLSHAVGSAGG